jgi:CrcB protein
MTPLLVFLGAGIGGVARYGIGRLITTPDAAIPRATLLVNVTGSLLIGAFAAAAQARGLSAQTQAFLIVGICGGYTTFSAFSAETLSLVQAGHWGRAATYAIASVVLCVAATLVGMRLGISVSSSGSQVTSHG